ncbi:MAG: tetratricopeptide repeat protein [Bryobacterales bacterium]|nr:tetratricopeptide repeat protein [Bryobacterales bacterium]
MPDWNRIARALAPYAVRYGGCAAAVTIGGPAALAIAGMAGRLFAPSGQDGDGDLFVEGGAGFGEAFAANLNGLITNLASERIKNEPSPDRDLRFAFRHALAQSLEDVREPVLKRFPDQQTWFENWQARFDKDEDAGLSRLSGVSDEELLSLFEAAPDPQRALWPVAERLLIGLDAEARRSEMQIVLEARAMPAPFAALLRDELTAPQCLPRLLGRELSQHDDAWRRVLEKRTQQIHAAVASIEGFPEAAASLLSAMASLESKIDALEGSLGHTDHELQLTRDDLKLVREDVRRLNENLEARQRGAAAAAQQEEAAPEPVLGNLPASASKFVGREGETARVRRLVSENRLVTLAGTPGAGKTRLSIEAARGLVPQFPDGAWLVELASKVDPEVVPGAIAEALGLREQASKPPTEALRQHLAGRRLLLVIDNCEHLHEACVAIADEILEHCPSVSILATSRFVLKTVFEETVHWVGALSLPPAGEPASIESLEASDAARLFVLRAKEHVRFKLTPENAEAVTAVCRRLDGIPLALEIAAAHLATLSPGELAQYLDEALELLVDDRRRKRKEHMSVRETLRWSYDLLDDDQQTLLRKAAVFEGTLTSERVRAVCAPGAPKLATLRRLDKLVERSMINVKSSPDGMERRLYLLEIIQQFGVDEMAQKGELSELEARHADYFLELTEQARPQLEQAPNERLLSEMGEAHDDVRVALQRLLEKGEVDKAARIGAAYWRYWEIRGLLAEGRRQLAKIIAACPPDDRSDAYSRVLSGAGLLAYRQGDMDDAGRLFRAALAIEQGREQPNLPRLAECLNDVGLVAVRRSEIPVAIDYYSQYLAIAERELGKRDVAVAHNNLGAAALALGKLDDAERHLLLSRDLFRDIHNDSDIAFPLTALGSVYVLRDDPRTAVAYLEQALKWREDLRNTRGAAEALNWLGRASLVAGDQGTAQSYLVAGLRRARQVEGARETADLLDSIALLALAREEPERAIALDAASDALRQASRLPRTPVLRQLQQEALDRARAALSPDAAEAARVSGASKPLDAVLRDYAYC